MTWFTIALKKYAVFGGRARRKEYWMFSIVAFLISFVLGLADRATGSVSKQGIGLLGLLANLFFLIPSLAVLVRRLHDTDRSAWWLLLTIIPFLGWLILLIFILLDSQPGENRFGQNPKELAQS